MASNVFTLRCLTFFHLSLFQITTTNAPEDVHKIGRGDCSATSGRSTKTSGKLGRSPTMQGSERMMKPSDGISGGEDLHGAKI